MIYLNPPFYVIDGVSLLPDHADRRQWYFMPLAPHLTIITDPADGKKKPSIQLIKYHGAAGNGGFINFDVNLGIDDDKLEDIGRQLQSQAGLADRPRLVPVPVVDGSVKLLILGAEDPPPPDPKDKTKPAPPPPPENAAAGPRFVVKLQHAAKPSLYGDEQAAFSVQLDQYGVTVLEQALSGSFLQPIGVIYELDFFALRPAFSVRCTVDWERVQTHLGESFGASVFCFSTEVDKEIDKLVESQAIKFEVDTFVTDTPDNQNAISDKDKAENEVREMIKSTFFSSSLPPPNTGPTDVDKDMKAFNGVSQALATGGASSFASVSYKKVDLTRIDKKALNVTFNERTTVRRTIGPQGHLAGVASALRAEGVNLSEFIVAVDLDNPFFTRRKVDAISRANFEDDSLASISVELKYGDDVKSVLLESSTGRGSVEWSSILDDKKMMKRPVTYHYQCTFKDVDRTERPVELRSAELTIEGDKLEIVPRADLYSVIHVPIQALGFPWDRYGFVEVQTRYDDESNQIHQHETFVLSPQAPEHQWLIFQRDPALKTFQYKLIYRGVDHADIELPWTSTDDDLITVRDPYPNKITLAVAPLLNWNLVDRAFVDVTYDDDTQSFEFNKGDAATKTYATHAKDPTRRTMSYTCTLMYKDGRMAQIPTSYTVAPRLIVRDGMKGHKIVSLRPVANGDFSGLQIKRLDVAVRYVDETNGLSFSDSFSFKSSGDLGHFEFDYVDENKSKFEYTVTTQLLNGLSRSIDWAQSDTDDVLLSVNG